MSTHITQILSRIRDGEDAAVSELVPLVYSQMRELAAAAIRKEPVRGCDATELVHEAYLRLLGNDELAWNSRSHFFAACAVVIRRILVDQARAKKRLKRGGDWQQQTLDVAQMARSDEASSVDLVALDDALHGLAKVSPRSAKLIELRYFGGMSEQEAADHLNISRRTASADWAMARAWLKTRMDPA